MAAERELFAQPPERLVDVAQSEDSGAETQDRYGWQHHCTAVDCLILLRDENIKRVVCEVHEDYVVERLDGLELVSCKHREPSRGPWTLTTLSADGGLAHLFSRWSAFETAYARLVTNAGLKAGKREAASIAKACQAAADGHPFDAEIAQCRDTLARSLLAANKKKKFEGIPVLDADNLRKSKAAWPIPGIFLRRVEEFMRVLRICPNLPSRGHIYGYHLENVVRPTLRAIGRDDTHASQCYTRLVALVAERNRANALAGRYATWLTDHHSGSIRGEVAALVAARTIYREDVVALLNSMGSTLLLRRYRATTHNRLRAKLIAGGVRETRINSAARIREAWLAAWSAYRNDLPGDEAEREDIEARVLEIAADVEALVATNEGDWGDRLYTELRVRLNNTVINTPIALSPHHLLGVALDLTAQCEIWFSDVFDVNSALAAAAQLDPPVGLEADG